MSYLPSKFVAETTGPLPRLKLNPGFKSWSCALTGPSSPVTTVLVEVSNDGTFWNEVGRFELSGSDVSKVLVTEESYAFHRFNVSVLTGTSARVIMSVSSQ